MDNPKAVGGDRIVAAVAAIARYEGPIIIIDMGTATTMDVVDRAGSYIGGVILPGVNVALNSLVSHTAQLPRINLDVPRRVIRKKHRRVYAQRIMLERRNPGRTHRPDGGGTRRIRDPGFHRRNGAVHHASLPSLHYLRPGSSAGGLWILYRQNTARVKTPMQGRRY